VPLLDETVVPVEVEPLEVPLVVLVEPDDVEPVDEASVDDPAVQAVRAIVPASDAAIRAAVAVRERRSPCSRVLIGRSPCPRSGSCRELRLSGGPVTGLCRS
jgi:hypothetical protein